MNWSKAELQQTTPRLNWQHPYLAETDAWQAYRDFYKLSALAPDCVHLAGRVEVGGFDLMVQQWRHPAAQGTAILVHGYYDHVGLYGSLVQFCLAHGLDVVCFDLPGHGLSSGAEAAIDDFQQYDAALSTVLQQVQLHATGPLYAFGQSTGGAILVNYLLSRQLRQYNSPFRAVTVFAPLVRPLGWRRGKVMHGLLHRFVSRLKRHFHANSADAEFLRFVAQSDPLQPRYLSVRWVGALKHWIDYIERQPASDVPLHIIQGDSDQTVDWRYNMPVLAEKFPQRTLTMIPNGQHHLVNERVELRVQIYQQLSEQLFSQNSVVA